MLHEKGGGFFELVAKMYAEMLSVWFFIIAIFQFSRIDDESKNLMIFLQRKLFSSLLRHFFVIVKFMF